MAFGLTSKPTIFTLRRDLAPSAPVLVCLHYQTPRGEASGPLVLTRSKLNCPEFQGTLECLLVRPPDPLWAGIQDHLDHLGGLQPSMLSIYLPRRPGYSTLLDLAELCVHADNQGLQVELIEPYSGRSFPFSWRVLVTVCLRYAGDQVPDQLLGQMIMDDLVSLLLEAKQ